MTGDASVLRAAEARDAAAIADIYNHEILTSTATFDTQPVTVDNRVAWLAAHEAPSRPVVVAEIAGDVVGWASLSSWSERCAYARAAEVSVYVHRDHRGRGIGAALLADLVRRGRQADLGVLLARICTEGEASIALHRRQGFSTIGIMRRVGEKFGRVLDIELMDLQLDDTP
ncbi:MAG: N-acetyltransferase family protein [Polyangiaceae bacterium]